MIMKYYRSSKFNIYEWRKYLFFLVSEDKNSISFYFLGKKKITRMRNVLQNFHAYKELFFFKHFKFFIETIIFRKNNFLNY